MQYAKCTEDNKTWEANDFAALPNEVLEIKRQNLLCVECNEFAWFRKESRHGHPAHFCAHHKNDCGLKVEYVVVDDGKAQALTDEEEVAAGTGIIVRLDDEQADQIDVAEVTPNTDPKLGGGGSRHVIKGGERESLQQFTLRRILHRLVQSPKFSSSNQQLTIYKNKEEKLIEGSIKNIVSSFENISKDVHNNQFMIFWGPISSAKKSEDGKLWLNSSERNRGTSVAIFQNIVQQFLSSFKVEELDELSGAHVLVLAKCLIAGTGKPVIWCASPKNIIVRRYKDANLQVTL